MKKPFSIVDAALNVIRVCLAAGILITLFDFFTRIDQTPAIVIRFPKSAETEETSGTSRNTPRYADNTEKAADIKNPSFSPRNQSLVIQRLPKPKPKPNPF